MSVHTITSTYHLRKIVEVKDCWSKNWSNLRENVEKILRAKGNTEKVDGPTNTFKKITKSVHSLKTAVKLKVGLEL